MRGLRLKTRVLFVAMLFVPGAALAKDRALGDDASGVPGPVCPPADPTCDWPVHFDAAPPPRRPSIDASAPLQPTFDAKLSDDDLWAAKLRRHHRNGAVGFALSYGGAALHGALASGFVLYAPLTKEDRRFYLYAVAYPFFVPVVGPIYLGGAAAVYATRVLLRTSGESFPLAVIVAGVLYWFSVGAIYDGVLQGAFLGQAFGWSDPLRPSATPKATNAPEHAGAGWKLGRQLRFISPTIVPQIQAPSWLGASPERSSPPSAGLQVTGTW